MYRKRQELSQRQEDQPSLSVSLSSLSPSLSLGSPSNPFSTLPISTNTILSLSLSLSPMRHIQILSKPHKQSLPSLHFPTPWSFLCLSLKNIIHLYSFLKDLFQKSLKTRKKKKALLHKNHYTFSLLFSL
jgi:hypothetical protein